MSRFIDEAKSHLTEEEEISIPFAQALPLLYLAESDTGRGGTAYTNYIPRTGKVCTKLISDIETCADTELVRVTTICCWGILNLGNMISWIYMTFYIPWTHLHISIHSQIL